MLRPDEEPTLAGRLCGKRALVRFLEGLPPLADPAVVALDFKGVALATSSFLDEAVLHFRDHLRLGRTPASLIVANLGDGVEEELDDLLIRASDALLSCKLSDHSEVSDVRLLGNLEPKLKETFDLVNKKGEASATELHTESDDPIKATAWNNRLNALVAKSLLIEIPLGRAKKYRPVLEVS